MGDLPREVSFFRHFMAETAVIGEEESVKVFNRRVIWSHWCFRGIAQVTWEGPVLEDLLGDYCKSAGKRQSKFALLFKSLEVVEWPELRMKICILEIVRSQIIRTW